MKLLVLFLTLLFDVTLQAAVPSYEVEVYFVVDQAVVNRYIKETNYQRSAAMAKLNTEIDYFLTEMNQMYASLQARGLNIKVLKKKVEFLNGVLFNDKADLDPALKSFDGWLAGERAYEKIKYDAAILWTGYELVSGEDTGAAGYAHVGTICGSKASGIVEYDMTFMTSITTAHELAHIMGASHDSDVTGYIMIPTSSTKEVNRWGFSLCTREAFDASISKLSTNCLLESSALSSAPNTEITDVLADPDTICRRSERNVNSYMCKDPHFYGDVIPQGDAVCKTIMCKEIGSTYCNGAFPSDGLICGTNKRCSDGKCKYHPDSKSAQVKDDCIWGDNAVIKFTGSSGTYEGDCPGYIARKGKSVCKYVEKTCCKTCGDLKTKIPDCPWGDTNTKCKTYTQAQICDKYRHMCCEFCHGYRKKRDADSEESSSDVTLEDAPEDEEVKDEANPNPAAGKKKIPPTELA